MEGRDEDDDAGRGGKGEVAVATSRVARWSELPAGAPQAEQNRPVDGTSIPQDEQAGMTFPDTVYRVRTKPVAQLKQYRENRKAALYYHPNDELAPPPLDG